MSQQKGAANKALYRSLIASDETCEKLRHYTGNGSINRKECFGSRDERCL